MNESLIEDFYSSLIKSGINLPEIVSQEKDAQSQGSLQDFIEIARETSSDRFLLPSLAHQLFEGTDKVAQVVQPYAFGAPGFSNELVEQLKEDPPNKIKETMAKRNIVAAVVLKKQADNKDYIRHIINEDVPRNVVASCEDQIINGNKSGAKGLLHADEAVSYTHSDALPNFISNDASRIPFYYHTLRAYASKANRMPTHIILPHMEIMRILDSVKTTAYATQEFPNKLFGIPVIESKFIQEGRGLMLAVDEILLASSPDLEWQFGCSTNALKSRGLSAIILKCKMGLLINRPETIFRLTLD